VADLTNSIHTPICFTRNKTRLHALLIDNQAWFCVRDLGHLMGFFSMSVWRASSTRTNVKRCGYTATAKPSKR